MKPRKQIVARIIMVSLCVWMSIAQIPLFTGNQEGDISISWEDEEDDVAEQEQSTFSKHKNTILITGGALAIVGTGLVINHLVNRKKISMLDQNNESSSTTSVQQEPSPKKTSSIEELQAETDLIVAGKSPVSLAPLNLIVRNVKKELPKAISLSHAMAQLDKTASKNYNEEFEKNPPLQKLRQDIEKVVSHDHDITKEEVRELATTSISALQKYTENHKNDLVEVMINIEELINPFCTKNDTGEIDPTLKETLEARKKKFLDAFIQQKPEDWVDVIEKGFVVLERNKNLPPAEKAKLLQKQTDNLAATQKKFSEITTKEALLKETQGMISDLKSGKVPEILKELVKETPLLSEVFPELQNGVIPPLLAPFFEDLAGSLDTIQSKMFPQDEGSNNQADKIVPLIIAHFITPLLEKTKKLHDTVAAGNPTDLLTMMPQNMQPMGMMAMTTARTLLGQQSQTLPQE